MSLAKVQARGQVTLPRSVRRSLGCKPGDTVAFQSLGNGAVELRVLPRHSLAELLDRYHIADEVEDTRNRGQWQKKAVEDVVRDQQ